VYRSVLGWVDGLIDHNSFRWFSLASGSDSLVTPVDGMNVVEDNRWFDNQTQLVQIVISWGVEGQSGRRPFLHHKVGDGVAARFLFQAQTETSCC
jgi:hypothetical protein